MAFKPGLELIEASLVGPAVDTLWSITFVEGPDSEDQFTLRLNYLWGREIKSTEIEVRSPLFTALNDAAHAGDPLMSLVGQKNVDFEVLLEPGEWISKLERVPSKLGFRGSIYPSPDSISKVLIDFNFFDVIPNLTVSGRRLADGFVASAGFVVLVLGAGALVSFTGLKAQQQSNDLQVKLKALEICVSLDTKAAANLQARVSGAQIHAAPRLSMKDEMSLHPKR